ncbi:MAG: hypothetical protein PF501_04250 [Salinisphaera sp.]|jgi:hypothetical protein|nr:hypothetical protein [Salinisphaera sp.]
MDFRLPGDIEEYCERIRALVDDELIPLMVFSRTLMNEGNAFWRRQTGGADRHSQTSGTAPSRVLAATNQINKAFRRTTDGTGRL